MYHQPINNQQEIPPKPIISLIERTECIFPLGNFGYLVSRWARSRSVGQ